MPSPDTRRRVLLVDDDDIIRTITSAQLEQLGFEALAAQGGQEALDLMKREGGRVDLVLLDFAMPQMSGSETFRRLRSRWPEGPPIVVGSGFEANACGADALVEAGAVAFLKKPYRLEQLREALAEILG